METWELLQPFPRRARLQVAWAPLIGGVLALALTAAGAIALATERLDRDESIQAWFLVLGGLAAAVFAVAVVRRRWALLEPGFPFLRVDAAMVAVRSDAGDRWTSVPWSNVAAVDIGRLELGADHPHAAALSSAQVLRFVPIDETEVPHAPPGIMDRDLGLSPEAARLSVVFSDARADASIVALLDWVRARHPGIPVQDRRPGAD